MFCKDKKFCNKNNFSTHGSKAKPLYETQTVKNNTKNISFKSLT